MVNSFPNVLPANQPNLKQKTRQPRRVLRVQKLLLPRALLVAVRLKAFPAFVLRHLEAALLLEISHGESWF
jgi:hypothetical protein